MSNLFEKTLAALWKKLGLPSPDDDWRRLRSQRRALDKQAIQQHMEWEDYRESYESIEDGRQAQRHDYQTLWLKEIKRRLMSLQEGTGDEGSTAAGSSTLQPVVLDETHKLMKLLLATLKGFADEFNELTAETPMVAQMHFVSTEVSEVKEQVSEKKAYGVVKKGAKSKPERPKEITYLRARVSTPAWSLSLRGWCGRIEFFLVPATELFLLSQSETPTRLKSVLRLNSRIGEVWTLDGLPADPDELFYLCRMLFKNLVFASSQGMKEELDTTSVLQNLEGESLRAAVRELIMAQQNLAQRIVSQQEEIQNRIARDLHDAVIADIMTLKRSLSDGAPTLADLGQSLDEVCERIRELSDSGKTRADVSLGIIQSQKVADRLKEAGVQCYGHNLETSKRFFPKQCSTHSYEDRVQTISYLKKAGVKICSGGIIGMGETREDRCDLAFALKEVGANVVPINILNPIKGTPFENVPPLAPLEILKTIACFRFILPRQEIMIAGGRTVNLRDMQSMGFHAGASALMVGNYLTTLNQPVERDLQMIKDLGLDPDWDKHGFSDQ